MSGLSLKLSNLQRLHADGLLYISKVADDAAFVPFCVEATFHMENLSQLVYAISSMGSSYRCVVVTECSCHGGLNQPRSAPAVSEV